MCLAFHKSMTITLTFYKSIMFLNFPKVIRYRNITDKFSFRFLKTFLKNRILNFEFFVEFLVMYNDLI